MAALRPGRKININYPGHEPIDLTVLSEPENIRILHPEFVIQQDGELRVEGRKERLVKFYSDGGFRVVRLAEITVL